MTDIPEDIRAAGADDAILSFGDAYAIGEKIVEAADRVRRINSAVPGATAKWGFEVDGDRFEVSIRMAAK